NGAINMQSDRDAKCRWTRREFAASAAASLGVMTLGANLFSQEKTDGAAAAASPRPNILWIVSEDNNPFLGCYGYKLARTPTLDRLAQEGVLYENCCSQAPVCAPSRFTLISGMYATSCGPANHMRAQGKIPKDLRGFPAYLRAAGYYCTNNAKTDYNSPISIPDAWDECSKQAHFRNRPKGKPFFAVFNHEITHESSLFPKKNAQYQRTAQSTDPAKITLPAYHPDTPEFRTDWAHYFDQIARLDEQAAKLLKELEDDGLTQDTIVFYYGDNGGVLPRSKRFPYDSGIHVPLIIRFPEKFKNLAPAAPGSRLKPPVSFVDFAPTVLSLAGVPIPKYMQGHPFAGPQNAGPQEFAFSFRNRMDERYDMVRTVRGERYIYLRNYMPHLIYGQHVQFMFTMTSMKTWYQMYREGKCVGPQKFFWEEKPEEELYDLKTDPYEVKNLATSANPEHQEILKRMRAANEQHILWIRDNGFIPEGSPLEGFDASRDTSAYPLVKILEVANTATKRDPANLPKLIQWLGDENECIRYWAALGCVMLRAKAAEAAPTLLKHLQDASGSVSVAAAEALCHIGQTDKGLPALTELLLKNKNQRVRLQAANALQNIGDKAKPALPAIEQALQSDTDDYVKRAVRYTAACLKGETPKDEG
ncbi:MAG: sulfatase-like hydrolase/transferase, partial [Candidatus Sumerlaeota bacterium]|nr:sulfatase-like hydrolase/transferase [Candidatus Sumerlaeota bacterium]